MRGEIRISIPEPCNVPWDSMKSLDEKNRHCSSCDRVIHDFTKMSDAELLTFFKQEGKLCGRFAPHQLNRKLFLSEKPKPKSWPVALLLSSLFLGLEAKAQTGKVISEKHAVVYQHSSQPDTTAGQKQIIQPDTLQIYGTVIDSATAEPLAGAVIFYQGKTRSYGCQSGFDGKYKLEIPGVSAGDSITVQVKYVGYEPYDQLILVTDKPVQGDMILKVSPDFTPMIGVIVEQHPVRSRSRHFFYRIFHWRRY